MPYSQILFNVDALQFDGENVTELRSFCPELITVTDPVLPDYYQLGETVINDTDWVVKSWTGRFYLKTQDEFSEMFEIIPE